MDFFDCFTAELDVNIFNSEATFFHTSALVSHTKTQGFLDQEIHSSKKLKRFWVTYCGPYPIHLVESAQNDKIKRIQSYVRNCTKRTIFTCNPSLNPGHFHLFALMFSPIYLMAMVKYHELWKIFPWVQQLLCVEFSKNLSCLNDDSLQTKTGHRTAQNNRLFPKACILENPLPSVWWMTKTLGVGCCLPPGSTHDTWWRVF